MNKNKKKILIDFFLIYYYHFFLFNLSQINRIYMNKDVQISKHPEKDGNLKPNATHRAGFK